MTASNWLRLALFLYRQFFPLRFTDHWPSFSRHSPLFRAVVVRSIPGEPGSTANCQGRARPTDQAIPQDLHDPHIRRVDFRVSKEQTPRMPPFRLGGTRTCILDRIVKDQPPDPDILSLQQGCPSLASVSGTWPFLDCTSAIALGLFCQSPEQRQAVLAACRVGHQRPEKLGVRHEAADVAVMTGRQPGHNPVCDHWYRTKTCGRSNPTVRSSWDNETSPDPGGRVSRERTRRLLAPRRSGARVDGMANPGELLINAVISSKPKALTGLNQKGKWPGAGAPHSPAVAVEPSAERQSLNHPWSIRGTW